MTMAYRDVLQALDPTGDMVIVPLSIIRRCGLVLGVFLSLVIHVVRQQLSAAPEHWGDWVTLSTRKMQEWDPMLTCKSIEWRLERLKHLGLLVSKVSKQRRRRVKLRVDDILPWHCQASAGAVLNLNLKNTVGVGTPPKGGYPTPPQLYSPQRKVKKITPRQSHCELCEDHSQSTWRDAGLQLRDGIAKVTTVPRTAKPLHWGEQLRALHERDGVPPDKIRTMVHWYVDLLRRERDINTNGNPNCFPVCYSGEAFRKKWIKLEGARARDERDGGIQVQRDDGRPPPGVRYFVEPDGKIPFLDEIEENSWGF